MAYHRSNTFIKHINQGQGNFGAATGIAVSVNVDARCHSSANVFYWSRITDTGSVVVDQVFLEFFDLIVVKDYFGEFSDAGVDTVHDLARLDRLVEHGAADLDPFQRVPVELDHYVEPGDPFEFLDGQR